MLLTITYVGKDTENLGYLLHKNPYRPQVFKLTYGKGYVFYPEVSNERTTAALLIDINPIDLAKGKLGSSAGGLFDYLNDRPFVTSSFMSNAISTVFSTAMGGTCKKMQELADTPLKLTAELHMLPCRGNADFAEEVFKPLGYEVSYKQYILDEDFPEWGDSAYIDLTISGTVKLSELLNHLFVLIPAFDKNKHYWSSNEEVEKLISHGGSWLQNHPIKERIVKRYFNKRTGLAKMAMEKLNLLAGEDEEDNDIEVSPEEIKERERQLSLNQQRIQAVLEAVLAGKHGKVMDLGCGEGTLTSRLVDVPDVEKILAADVSPRALAIAKRKLHYDNLPPYKQDKLELIQAGLTYRNDRFRGYDCACLVEVIEHIDPYRLETVERVIFEYAAPERVIVTTPNKEYNVKYEWLPEDWLRNSDHRFEWTREEFRNWAEKTAEKYGYKAEYKEVGEVDEELGAPTQMEVFTKCV